MKASKACFDLIKKWEGYHDRLADGSCAAYQGKADAKGVITIGWGSIFDSELGRRVRLSDVWSADKADRMLRLEVKACELDVDKEVGPTCTQPMFDALVSFTYNLGFEGNNDQTRRVREGKFEECALKFKEYNKADGKVVEGLINRRRDEEALFRSGMVATGVGSTFQPVKLPYTLPAGLILGLDDNRPEVTTLQNALIELGYLATPQEGELVGTHFNEHVDYAVKTFQKESLLTADGLVGPATASSIDKAISIARGLQPAPSLTQLKLSKSGIIRSDGLHQLHLETSAGKILCTSGGSYYQLFLKPEDPRSKPESMQPIPQGKYTLGAVDWAGATNDWATVWSSALGPFWVDIFATFWDDRGEFGFHMDWNYSTGAYGSAGCVVFDSRTEANKFLSLFKTANPPKELLVNWGL